MLNKINFLPAFFGFFVFPIFLNGQVKLQEVARYTRTNYLHNLGLTGKGMTMYVIETIPPLENRQFEGRLTISDQNVLTLPFTQEERKHSTMVSGIVLSGGILGHSNMKGMAYEAKGIFGSPVKFPSSLRPDLWGLMIINCLRGTREVCTQIDDLPNYIAKFSDVLISTHSYETALGSDPELYGSYSILAKKYDEAMHAMPYWLPVVAAGNKGMERNPTAFLPGYDLLHPDLQSSKNSLTVANASKVILTADDELIAAMVHGSSTPGPTNDFRVKPEITGFGTNVLSCSAEKTTVVNGIENTNYFDEATGTSFSVPNVSGTLLLLQQHFKNLYQRPMLAATLKGLALHTADFMATTSGNVGPDPFSGWGLLNAKFAGQAITGRNVSSIIEELTLLQGEVYTLNVKAIGLPLKVSISWTDPEGIVPAAPNSDAAVLINDLDVTVSGKRGTFSPYLLVKKDLRGLTHIAAVTGDNKVDPYERVDINATLPGEDFVITISHKGILKNGAQNFSLIITWLGEADKCLATARIIVPVKDRSEIAARDIDCNTEVSGFGILFKAIRNIIFSPGTWIRQTDFHGLISDCDIAPAAIAVVPSGYKSEKNVVVPVQEANFPLGLRIHPNPAKESVTIFCEAGKIESVQLFSINGRLLVSRNYNKVSQAQLSIAGLAANVYFIIARKDDGTIIRTKLIKQ